MSPTTAPSIDTVNSLIDEFVAALVNARIYDREHPRIQNSIAEVQRHLLQYRDENGEDVFSLSATKDFLIYRRRPLVGASLAAARLLKVLKAWGSGGLELHVVSTRDDITRFFETALQKPADGENFETVNRRLADMHVASVRLLPPYTDRVGGGEGSFHVPMRLYQSIVDLLQDTTIRVCQGGTIDFGQVQSHAEEVLTRLDGAEGPMLSLARQDQYDAFTFGHSVRVAVLAMNFARALTADRDMLVRIGSAALLHDVGKSLIPFEILHSKNALSADERRIMNTHTDLGAELLLDHHESDPLAISAAFGHHCGCVEHAPDEGEQHGYPRQGGYPRMRHVHELALVTEIVKICDIYEALTAARPYKKPMTPTRAYRVMMSMGHHVHRALLQRFIGVNGIWPAGQLVLLTSGEVARVVQQGATPMTPTVEIVRDRDGAAVEATSDSIVDLAEQDAGELRAIQCVFEAGAGG